MCGILLNIGDERIAGQDPALEIISHRGPDAFGAENFELAGRIIGLGHRRLSIIDLSESGAQPMSYAEKRFWIVFNGEIYNYREIREELSKQNFQFRSSCDTEVILAAYLKWGKKCLHRFNGMFSFAILDRKDEKIFIARDRFGIKPMFYVNTPQSFRLASEIKQFIGMKGFHPQVNKTKLYHFLNSGDFCFDNETLWQNVEEMPPGHLAELDLSIWQPGQKLPTEQWYSPPFFDEKLKIGFEDAICEFRRLLDDSVRLRLRSDVPVGFLLSGGLDSSTLVGLAHKMPGERPEQLKTYSSCYDKSKADEREYISEMLKFTGAEYCLHFPSPEDVSANVEKVVWHNDLPILHGSPTVHWLLYERIKAENDSRKVIIEGQGGDEIMCGYGDFHWAFLNEKLHSCLFEFFSQLKTFQSFHHEPWKIIARKLMRINFPASVKYPPNPLLRAKELLGDKNPIPPIAIKREEPDVPRLHRNRFTILRYILHNVDRNSMAHSREARVPFLDYRLVEFCLRLPSELKISDGHSKRVLRQAAATLIPEKIARRVDKQGYSSPVANWAKKAMRPWFENQLANFANLPFVRKKSTLDSFKAYIEEKSHFDPILWRFITTGIWLEKFKIKY